MARQHQVLHPGVNRLGKTAIRNRVDFQTDPAHYRFWKVLFDGPLAEPVMDVDPAGGLFEDYELKLNSYDLGVDI